LYFLCVSSNYHFRGFSRTKCVLTKYTSYALALVSGNSVLTLSPQGFR
jgi:hypothetical protein